MTKDKKAEILYHYCSASAFHSIISSRSIRLSSLSLSNDSMEGKLVRQAFERFIEQHDFDTDIKDHIKFGLDIVEDLFDGLGFCLSEKPDLLSQWRGYADDAKGFSIGFNKKYLEEISNRDGKTQLEEVLYEQEKHDSALKTTFDFIREEAEKDKEDKITTNDYTNAFLHNHNKLMIRYREMTKRIATKVSQSYSQLFVLKGHAFHEESEWRMLSLLPREFIPDDIEFRAATNRLIPFRTIQLDKNNQNYISEVYIGPKNITPKETLRMLLISNGFEDVEIKFSEATYR